MTGTECVCTARYVGDDWRLDLWIEVFGKPEAPIVHAQHPQWCDVGNERILAYSLDKARVPADQLDHLAAGLAAQFNMTVAEVEQVIAEVTVPIRAANVVVSWCPELDAE